MSCVVCNNKNCNCQIFHKETLERVRNNLITDDEITRASDFLKVLSDFTRAKIILALKDEELCVCDIGTLVGITKSAVSHQMRTLRNYNIVSSRREGKMVYYKLNKDYAYDVIKNIHRFYGGYNEKEN